MRNWNNIHMYVHASMYNKNKKKNNLQLNNKNQPTKSAQRNTKSVKVFFNMQTVGQKFVSMQTTRWLTLAHAQRTLKTQAQGMLNLLLCAATPYLVASFL